jgi:hypothetical protein
MKRLITLFGFALVLVVTPALEVAAYEACPPCCEHGAEPCEADGEPCAALSMGACCDDAPVVPTPTANRMPELPAAVAIAVEPTAPTSGPTALRRREAVHWWMQPTRFSVDRRL